MKGKNLILIIMLLGFLLLLIKSDYLTYLGVKLQEREGITNDHLGVQLNEDD